jgi:hypothetical protein
MKMNYVIPQLNANAFYTFIKLNKSEQAKILRDCALKLDTENDGDDVVNLYYLNGFFVEEIISGTGNNDVTFLPFKRGYKLEKFLKDKGAIEMKASFA